MPKWLRRAERDLDEVEAYIAQDNPRAAVDTVLAIITATEQLDEFPGMGRPGRIPGTRELLIEGLPYIVPYRQRGKVIEILRVLPRRPSVADPVLVACLEASLSQIFLRDLRG